MEKVVKPYMSLLLGAILGTLLSFGFLAVIGHQKDSFSNTFNYINPNARLVKGDPQYGSREEINLK